jgi:hypothetical protein
MALFNVRSLHVQTTRPATIKLTCSCEDVKRYDQYISVVHVIKDRYWRTMRIDDNTKENASNGSIH